MSAVQAFIQRVDNSLNPIVIKELRQAVQSKFVTGILLLFLFLQVATISFFLINAQQNVGRAVGQDTFTTLLLFLLGACIVAIPGYTGFRLASERADAQTDLLFISTITPEKIIRGKFFAAMVLVFLFYSACMPFMALTFFLRGIDLLSLFAILLFSLIFVALSVLFEVLLACLPVKYVFRVILGVFSILALLWMLGVAAALASNAVSRGLGQHILNARKFWLDTGPFWLLMFFGMGLFYKMAVATISPPAANRALPVRRYITVSWAGAFVAMFLAMQLGMHWEYFLGWYAITMLLLGASVLFAVCERDTLGKRLRRTIPEGGFRQLLAFFHFSGAANGILWSTVMAFLSSLAIMAIHVYSGTGHMSRMGDFIMVMVGIYLYFLFYACLASFLQRNVFSYSVPRQLTWLFAILLAGICSTVPYLVASLFFGDNGDLWLMANPFMLGEYRHWKSAFFFSLFAGLGALAINLPWLAKQWIQFIPLQYPKVPRREGA